MSKKVNIAAKPPRPSSQDADKWVEERAQGPKKEKTETKRLTLDLDADLHRRMKVVCAKEGIQMAEEIRRLLAKRFPAE